MAWDRSPDRYRGVPRHVAQRIRRRDDHTCQRCGADGHEVDHIRNVKAGGSDDDSNLVTLCTRCHDEKTRREAAAGRAAKGRRRPPEPHPGLLR